MNNIVHVHKSLDLPEDKSQPRLILAGADGLKSMTDEFNERAAANPWGRYHAQWQIFTAARNWPEMKRFVEKRLAEIVHRDNPFTPATRLAEILDSKIYGLHRAPRVLKLPEQRTEAVSHACKKQPRILSEIYSNFMHKFLGNVYSWDFSQMVDIGKRGISIQDVHDNFPRFYQRLFGSSTNPDEIKDLRFSVRGQRDFLAALKETLTEADLPILLKMIDYPEAQSDSSSLICGDWDLFVDEYDGVGYTDCFTNLDGAVAEFWPTTEIHRDWAIANSSVLGTVADFIKAGLIAWPRPKPSSGHPLRDAFLQVVSHCFKEGREDLAEDKKFQANVKEIMESRLIRPALTS